MSKYEPRWLVTVVVPVWPNISFFFFFCWPGCMRRAPTTCWLRLASRSPCSLPASCEQWISHAVSQKKGPGLGPRAGAWVWLEVLVVSHKRAGIKLKEEVSHPLLFMIHEWLIFNVSLLKHNLFYYSPAQYAPAGLSWGNHTLDKPCRGGRGLRSARLWFVNVWNVCSGLVFHPPLSPHSGQQSRDKPEEHVSLCFPLERWNETLAGVLIWSELWDIHQRNSLHKCPVSCGQRPVGKFMSENSPLNFNAM